jgi:hypothetical protein
LTYGKRVEDLPSKWLLKTGRVAILISDKVHFKTKLIRSNKEGHFILIKGAIHQEETTVNLYAPNVGVPKFIKIYYRSKKHTQTPSDAGRL